MNRMKIRIRILILILIMTLPQVVFANTDTASSVITYFEKNSDNRADAYICATVLTPRKIVSRIELQWAPEGSEDFTVKAGPYTKTVTNATSVSRLLHFTIQDGYKYRVRFDITDELDDVESTVTVYADLQDQETDA